MIYLLFDIIIIRFSIITLHQTEDKGARCALIFTDQTEEKGTDWGLLSAKTREFTMK